MTVTSHSGYPSRREAVAARVAFLSIEQQRIAYPK
jgi:hypothetical protein